MRSHWSILFLIFIDVFIKLGSWQTSETQSVVTVSKSRIQPGVSFTVHVQAKDNGGINIITGGDKFYVDFRDSCTWSNLFECIEPPGSTNNIISTPFRVKMNDNGDGTYIYTYSVRELGRMQISVFLYGQTVNTITADYSYWDPTWIHELSSNVNALDQDFGSGDIYSSRSDNVEAIFKTSLFIDNSGTYELNAIGDDFFTIFLEGNQIIFADYNNLGSGVSATIYLEGPRMYSLKAIFIDGTMQARYSLRWNQSGSMLTIPAANFDYPKYVESLAVTSSCPEYSELIDGEWINLLAEDSSQEAQILNYVACSVVASGVIVNSLSLIMSTSSSQSIFSTANQIQLLLLLPLLKVYMPKSVIDFYRELSWALFSLNFLKIDLWPRVNQISNSFSKEQTDPYLKLIGIGDYSSVMNIIPSILMLLLFVWFHFFIGILYYRIKDKPRLNVVERIVKKVNIL
jgi:hypothetical protein